MWVVYHYYTSVSKVILLSRFFRVPTLGRLRGANSLSSLGYSWVVGQVDYSSLDESDRKGDNKPFSADKYS